MMKSIFVVTLIAALSSAQQQYPQLPQLNMSSSPYNTNPTYLSTMTHGRPSLYPAMNFNPSNDAAALKNAMHGIGTDEDAIINVLCKRSQAQRLEIKKVYQINYSKDLVAKLKSETDGSFGDLLLALLKPTIEFYTTELHNAMSRKGTDEAALLDIMPVLTNVEMRQVGGLYKESYGKTLEEKLTDDLSGGFENLMVCLAKADRDESVFTNPQAARADAVAIKSAISLEQIDEISVNKVLCQRNFEQIKLINDEYKKLTGQDLEEDIKLKFSGDHQSGLKSVLRYALNHHKFFASRLFKAMDGVGTDNKSLSRIIVSRCEIDMENIKDEYKKAYEDTLRTAIGNDNRGDYKHALYTLINEREKPSK